MARNPIELENILNGTGDYKDLFSEENFKTIREKVCDIVFARCPKHQKVTADDNSIKNALSQVVANKFNHPQIMIQIAINLLSEQLIEEIETQAHNNSLDPWIQSNPETFGISNYNPQGIKLDQRKAEPLQFSVWR